MKAFRFACMAVALGMAADAAQAQHRPVVQVASQIEFASEASAGEVQELPLSLQSPGLPAGATQFSLSDDTIDALAESAHSDLEVAWTELPVEIPIVAELADGACACGQSHCHGVCRDPGVPKKPLFEKPGDRNRGDCPPLRYRMDDCERAGNPHCYHRWAKCSVDDKYSAWFVGGGSPFPFGRARTSAEGTWGLDYNGAFFGHAKTWLNYTRGRNQGGIGAYRTDGEPKIVSRTHELLHLGH